MCIFYVPIDSCEYILSKKMFNKILNNLKVIYSQFNYKLILCYK